MTLEEMIKDIEITQIGTFLFIDYLMRASNKQIPQPLAIWQKHYDSLPSYSTYRGPDYLEKMKTKYIETYKLSIQEIEENK